jgi:hypothetical protein
MANYGWPIHPGCLRGLFASRFVLLPLSHSAASPIAPHVRTVGLKQAMYLRASAIRGTHRYPSIPPAVPKRYGLADALHLAAAIESGCDVFLTNDHQLANFPDIRVEQLP